MKFIGMFICCIAFTGCSSFQLQSFDPKISIGQTIRDDGTADRYTSGSINFHYERVKR